ncbi:hypothetical protein L1987_03784 [Smallanthus sonchifolius]|uniref:Uncharacterized protein n=1 Tax=Smallanthus sonchifolius TaxID=185202 RepID=A0ACB9KBM7_9ASTR|nr:hypothetical protein L1987_03784 [Smallanthus sonchifolius]
MGMLTESNSGKYDRPIDEGWTSRCYHIGDNFPRLGNAEQCRLTLEDTSYIVINERFGIVEGLMTTVHSITVTALKVQGQLFLCWEGSAADGRILRSAMIRENGMQVPKEMAYDPFDDDEFIDTNDDVDDEDLGSHVEHITTIGTSNEWTNFRQNLATSMGPGKNKKKWNEKEDEKLVASMLNVLNSAKWRGKKFPHYRDLCIVFGKDRANGRDAQTAADIISNINREETEANGDGLDDIDVDQPLNNPLDAASREESSAQRKRKRRNSWDPLMNMAFFFEPQHFKPSLAFSLHLARKLSLAAGFVKELHDLVVQKKGYKDVQEVLWESNPSSYDYGSTFPKDSICTMPFSWASTDPSTFLVRGDKSNKREDGLAGQFHRIVQREEKAIDDSRCNHQRVDHTMSLPFLHWTYLATPLLPEFADNMQLHPSRTSKGRCYKANAQSDSLYPSDKSFNSYFNLHFPNKFLMVFVNHNVTTKYPEIFKADVRVLLMELMKAAAAGGWLQKFATGTIAGPNLTTIYAFVQCRPNLSAERCIECLENAVDVYYLYGHRAPFAEGTLFQPTCNFKYITKQFFDWINFFRSPPPPPATMPLSAPPDGIRLLN